MNNQENNLVKQALLLMAVQPKASVRNLASQLNVSRYFIENVQDRLSDLKLTADQAVG